MKRQRPRKGAAMQTDTLKPFALAPGAGEAMAWFDATLMLKVSAPDIGIIETEIGPGSEPPMHVHAREDEWFYLLDGEVTFYAGDEVFRGEAGSVVSFPRGVPHTFEVETPSAR